MDSVLKEEKTVSNHLLLAGYLLALLGGMVGLFIGNHLLTSYITLQGEEIYKFDEGSRLHGKIITTLAVSMIILCMCINLALKI